MTTGLVCPRCGETSALLGVVDHRVYDGPLWWRCLECEWAWQTWPPTGRRWREARLAVTIHNTEHTPPAPTPARRTGKRSR